jgi:hypothetical protein
MTTFSGEPTFNTGRVEVNTAAVRLARESGHVWRNLSFDERLPFVRRAQAEYAAKPRAARESWVEKWESEIAVKMTADGCFRGQAIERLSVDLTMRDLRMRAIGESAGRSGCAFRATIYRRWT